MSFYEPSHSSTPALDTLGGLDDWATGLTSGRTDLVEVLDDLEWPIWSGVERQRAADTHRGPAAARASMDYHPVRLALGDLAKLRSTERAGVALEIRNDEDALSKTFFVVLTYAETEQERARQLARYLFEQGLESARIRLCEGKEEGQFRWATLVYVPDPARAQIFRDKLKTVPPPEFEPRFALRQAESIDLVEFR